MAHSSRASAPTGRPATAERVWQVPDAANGSEYPRQATTGPLVPAATHKARHMLPARARHIADARSALKALLNGSPITDDVLLCASEVVTHSVVHGDSDDLLRYYTLSAELYDDGHIRVEIEDAGRPWPVLIRAAGDGGLGLLILRELASSWGAEGTGRGRWTVWFEVAPEPRVAEPQRAGPPAMAVGGSGVADEQ